MRSIALERAGVIVGVDTHKDEHVAVALDGVGSHLGELHLDATNLGYAELLAWALALGDVRVFAVEGCGSYGIGLARFLRRHGHTPVEVSRPPRAGERRLSGKSDAIDAEHAARSVLAGTATVIPKLADGQVEAIRLLRHRRWSPRLVSVSTSPRRYSSPPVTTLPASATKRPSRSFAGSVRSPPARARPTAGTGSIVAGTARPTPRSTAR